jgi:hypothetical protein
VSPIYVLSDDPAPVTLTYGGLDLNDGTIFSLREGFDFGEPEKVFDEYRSYAGTVAQANVNEAVLVQVTLPIVIRALGYTIQGAIDLINAKIDAGAQDLVYDEQDGYGATTYHCVESPRLNRAHMKEERSAGLAFATLQLWRTP